MAGRAVRVFVTNRSVLKMAFIVKVSFLSIRTLEAFNAEDTAKAGILMLKTPRLPGKSTGDQSRQTNLIYIVTIVTVLSQDPFKPGRSQIYPPLRLNSWDCERTSC